MTYSEIMPLAIEGKLIKLPHYEGIFKWDYGKEDLVYTGYEDYSNILDRTDFYYII